MKTSGKYNFCTLFDSYYLTRGIALYKSLELNCGDFHLYIFAFDAKSQAILEKLNLKHATIISLKDFENEDLLQVKPTRTIGEYCWTCTASTIYYSITKFNLDHCAYLDADLQFFSSPSPIYEEIGSNSIGITPHNFSPKLKSSEIYGKYCVQFTYFKNDTDGMQALNWWKKSCIEWCFAKLEDGKYGDQKYLDYFHDKFNNVCDITHIGVGVAPWNISYFNIEIKKDKIFIESKKETSKKYLLIFYHYQGLKFEEKEDNILVEASYLSIPDIWLNYIYEKYVFQIVSIKNQIENNPVEQKKIVFQRKLIRSIAVFFRITLKDYSPIRALYYFLKKSRTNQPKRLGGYINNTNVKTLLQINTVVNSGSVGRMAEDIGQIAIENGWESTIAFGRNKRASKSNLIKIGNRLDHFLHGLQTRLFDKHGFGSKNATNNLINQIRKINPDVILLHNLHGYYINIELLFNFLKSTKIPILWVQYDCWSFTGHCCYFEIVDCRKWENGCNNCPQIKNYPTSWFIDRSKVNYLKKKIIFNGLENINIIANSNWLVNHLTKSFLNRIPIFKICSGVDIEKFSPKPTKEIKKKYSIQNKFVILGVANDWGIRKGLNDFLELSKLLDSNIQVLLLGLNKKQINELPPNIIGLSRTESIFQLAEFYSAADVFVNPTWEDNFPTTNLEALACGTPVVTYDTGGSIESVSPETGFIVKKGDIDGLNNAINIIKVQGKEYYTKQCIVHARNNFNKNDQYIKYLKLMETQIIK